MSEAKFTGHLLPTTITYDPKTGKCKEVLASHATESAAPDTLHFCAACWAGNHGSCSGDKCGCAHDSASVSTAQLDAEDQHRAAEQPVGDVVSRMLDAWYTDAESHPYDDLQRACMTDALAVAREGYVKLEDVEKAMYAQGNTEGGWPAYIKGVMARLAPKPETTLAEEVDAILGSTPCTCNAGSRKHAVEQIAALLKRRTKPRELKG